MGGLLLHHARLAAPQLDGWAVRRSLSTVSPDGRIRAGLDVRQVQEVRLDEFVDAVRLERDVVGASRLRASERAVVRGFDAVREHLESTTPAGDVPRVELLWIESEAAWCAWAMGPVAEAEGDAELVALVDAVAAGSEPTGGAVANDDAKRAWRGVTSSY